jgi:hypothetical protein
MNKTLSLNWRTVPKTVAVVATVLLVGACVQAAAQPSEPGSASAIQVQFTGSSSAGHAIITSRGPAFVTGHGGSMDTVMLPGNGAPGLLTNNGNGSSTLFTPGGAPQTVFTPR